MIAVGIVVSPELRQALDPARLEAALDATVNAAAESLRLRIAQYPGPSHSPVIWRSAAEKRDYFAMRRRAGLPPKYTRQTDRMSQRLGPGWAVRRVGNLVYVVGNKATYASDVQSAERQHPQHAATGWITDRQAVAELVASGDIEKAGRQALAYLTGVV